MAAKHHDLSIFRRRAEEEAFRDEAALSAMREVMRGMPIKEEEPGYATTVADVAWKVARAMCVGRKGRL
jgi:hypothetical protein